MTRSIPRGRVRDARRCDDLFARWDPMFSETVDRTRKGRIEAILETMSVAVGAPARVVDLASGPGPVTARVLRRFPDCHVVAVDTDPVLLQVGQIALRRYRPRVEWVLADLRKEEWAANLERNSFDAVVSSLALHWFYRTEIRAIFRSARALLRSGGVLLNGDFLPTRRPGAGPAGPSHVPRPSAAGSRSAGNVTKFKRRWTDWWNVVVATPALAVALRERELRLPGPMPPRRTTGPKTPATLEWHEQVLRSVGFRRVVVSWRDRDFRVLAALR